jgi:hypothetical protein
MAPQKPQKPPQDTRRIGELEDVIKDKDRRIAELKAEVDEARELIARQNEAVEDCNNLIDSWIEAFGMQLGDDGKRSFASWVDTANSNYERYVALRRKWNRTVASFNAVMGERRPVGRPLAADEDDRYAVLRLRAAGKSLRAIAEETNLGLQTVRTVVDQHHGCDRTTVKRLERIQIDSGEERTWKSRKRTRDALPRRISAVQEAIAEVRKAAKGLK